MLIGWPLLIAAGAGYARVNDIPLSVAAPLIAAFLIEYCFYLIPGFEEVRERIARRLPPARLAGALAASALLPYLVFALGAGQFRWSAAAALAALAAVVAFWYVVFRPGAAADLPLLALLAVVMLAKVFRDIYPDPWPNLRVDILGQLMMIRLGATAMLLLRRVEGVDFGFLPTRTQWKAGVLHFLYFVLVGLPLGLAIGAFRFDPSSALPYAPAVFLGMLWVVALMEEFFFRGLLQQWTAKWTGSVQVALIAAAVAFGLSHLGFREFPNWRLALVAAVAGWFYGRAYLQTGSIRAAMVAHALVATTWRTLFW